MAEKKPLYSGWSKISLVAAIVLSLAVWLFSRQEFFTSAYWLFWLYFPLMMLHHFEKFTLSDFRGWINKVCFKSNDANFPLKDETAFYFNVVLGYLIPLALILLAPYSIVFPTIAVMYALNLAWFHISYTVGERAYSPGFFTSIFLLLPWAPITFYHYVSNGELEVWMIGIAFILGLAMHYSLFFRMRLRLQGK
ncbi:HXXEE domain-containing protein [Candidatus Woesearchaeota archaeon]|nr:HXXEE domain-containing protein [Candidatus Woesearchaeota archaeon]